MPKSANTIAAALWPASGSRELLRDALLVVAGSLLMTLAAKIQVPFWPVPMSMQSGAMLLIGAAYGGRLAALSIGFYLLQGAFGLAVFAGGGGLAYLAGPTGGYLVGFLLGAAALGHLVERGAGRSVLDLLFCMLVAEVILFGLGIAWLTTLIGFEKAIAAGLVPFLPGEALKLALATVLVRGFWLVARRDA
jgi:biotin transport system substrate-specific component